LAQVGIPFVQRKGALPKPVAVLLDVFMTSANQTGKKLFAVYLGGRAPRCNTELHDVVFMAGESVEASYERLMDKWFGDPLRLHIDSWVELKAVDGYRISLQPYPPAGGNKLFFINLGAYLPGQFTELHGQHIHLEPTSEKMPLEPHSAYIIIPPEIVAAYAARLGK
jgi:hypothetical protein